MTSTPGRRKPLPRRGRLAALVTVLVAVLWLALPAPPASAHAYLLGSTPPAGYALPVPPTAISLDFDQPVSLGAAPLSLADSTGTPRPLGPVALSLGGRRLSAPVAARLGEGGYRIRWQVTADDGDIVSGTITFAVGTAAPVPAAADGSGAALDPPIVVIARWALFAGLALALGGAMGDLLARRIRREVNADGPARPRPLLAPGAALGALAALTLGVVQVGLDLTRLLTTEPGRILAVEILAFTAAGLLAAAVRHRRGLRVQASVVPLLAVIAAEGLRAHPNADNPIWGAALTITHLIAVSVWIGALAHVLRTARRWRARPGWTRLLVHDYARLALALVAVVVATGTAEALIMLPTPAALIDTAYGLVLLAKLVLVAVVLTLAALARRRLRRSIQRADTSTEAGDAGRPTGRAVRLETTLLAGVLAVTAVLVSLAPPGPVTATLAAPPLPVGPVVPAGTLAGPITVIATASAGQLVIRMTEPGRDDLGTDNAAPEQAAPPPNYQLAAQLAPPGRPPQAVTLRGCGPGCFTSPTTWSAGTNTLRLTVTAPPWPSSTATLELPWPPRPDPTVLPKILAAMKTEQFIVHEAVTSDYTGNPGFETPLPFTGPEFLATEPYGSGAGTPVILASRPEEAEIGLLYPQGIAIHLFIGDDDRILREETTTPNHLITATFEYLSATHP